MVKGRKVTGGKYHKFIPSRWRSTIVSINSLLINVIGILYLFIFGILSDKFSYKSGFIITAIYQLIIISILLFILGFDKHLKKKEQRLK